MSAKAWLIIAIVGFSLAAVLLIAALVLFFNMKIPDVMADLSGKKSAKGLKEIRGAASGQNEGGRSVSNGSAGVQEKGADAGKTENIGYWGKRGTVVLCRDGTVPLFDMTADIHMEDSSAAAGVGDIVEFGQGNDGARGGTMVLDSQAASEETGVTDAQVRAPSGKTTMLPFEERPTASEEAVQPTTYTGISDEAAPVRAEYSAGTTVLQRATQELAPESEAPVRFEVLRSVIVTHTDDVIR